MSAELYLFEDNGTYEAFTPQRDPVTFESRVYYPTIMTRSKITLTDNIAKSPISFKFERTHTFARRVLHTLPEIPILVTVFKDSLPEWKGKIINAKEHLTYIEVTCDSIWAAQLKSGNKITISPQCFHLVYSRQCGVDESLWRSNYTGVTVTSINIVIAAMDKDTGYFNNGKAEFHGEKRHILSHIENTITLSSPFNHTGTGILSLYPGCDLTERNCKLFNNLDNHLGFDRLPDKNPFNATGLL
jgi:hypothetical protein